MKYWLSLIGTNFDKCRESGVLAFADYSKGNDLYFSQEDKTMKATSTSTNVISDTWKYIQYQNNTPTAWKSSSTDFSWFSWKTMTINLAGSVGSNTNVSPQTKFYVADFGTEQYYVINNWKCVDADSSWRYLCKKIWNTQTNLWSPPATISLTLTATPTQMIIWNAPSNINWIIEYKNPIWTTIQSIVIEK